MSSITIMSFNIGGSNRKCEETRQWDKRAAVCNDIFSRYDTELIGLQEMQLTNRSLLDSNLSKYEFEYGVKTVEQADENALYNPIYWKKERFEKLDSGSFYLSPTPNRWSKAWDAMYTRSATWVRLRRLETNIELIFMNIHLDHHGTQSRIESSKMVVSQIQHLQKKDNIPVILSGDFNSRAWAPVPEHIFEYPPPVLPQYLPEGGKVLEIYTQRNFKDTYLEAGYTNQLEMNTYHDYYGKAFPPVALRIDWILTLNGEQEIRVKNYTIVYDALPPIFPSDHYPIIVELA